MKKLIFMLFLIPSLVFAAEYEKWAMVEDGKIIQFKTVDVTDEIIKPKLKAHNYVIVEESIMPDYNIIEESVTSEYVVELGKVTKAYTILKRSDVEIKEIKTRMAEEQVVSDFKKLLSADIEAIDTKPILDAYKQQLTSIEAPIIKEVAK